MISTILLLAIGLLCLALVSLGLAIVSLRLVVRLRRLETQLRQLERRLYPSPGVAQELIVRALKARPGSVPLSPELREALARSVRQFDE